MHRHGVDARDALTDEQRAVLDQIAEFRADMLESFRQSRHRWPLGGEDRDHPKVTKWRRGPGIRGDSAEDLDEWMRRLPEMLSFDPPVEKAGQ